MSNAVESVSNPEMKFYSAANVNSRVAHKGREFKFQPFAFVGGCWYGVLATADPAEQAALAELIASGKSSVREISAEQFKASVESQKKTDALRNYSPLTPEPVSTTPPARLNDSRPAAVVAEGRTAESEPPPPKPTAEPLGSVAAALVIGEVPAERRVSLE